MRGDSTQARPDAHFATGSPPTCVGTARQSEGEYPFFTVHPHMRGDSLVPFRDSENPHGSPPHAWGQLYPVLPRFHHLGFTPTCVGTARERMPSASTGMVHPHMRGDSASNQAHNTTASGSPPHAWGQPLPEILWGVFVGFTPTCVGTAKESRTGCPIGPVHPHMRGDSGYGPGHGSPR